MTYSDIIILLKGISKNDHDSFFAEENFFPLRYKNRRTVVVYLNKVITSVKFKKITRSSGCMNGILLCV